MNSSSVWRQLKIYLADPVHTVHILFVLLGGYSLALFFWEIMHRQELAGYALNNQLPSGEYPSLALLAGTAILACALWVILSISLARLTKKALDTVLTRLSGVFLSATLLVFLPVLSLPGIETDQQLLTLALIGAMGVIAATAVATIQEGFPRSAEHAVTAAAGSPQEATGRPARRDARLANLLVVLLTLGYIAYMAALTVARHNSFLTHAFDLGIQDQAMYTLVTNGYPLVTQYGSQPINQFGDHFALIYYAIAPLYAAFSSATTLLILQSVALGLGAIPVYLLAKDKIGSLPVAVALAAAYLLYPALHAVNTFDFHEIALVTPLLLFSLYFLEKDRRGLFVAFLILATLTKEEVALSSAAIGLYVLWVKRERRLGGLVLIGSLAYFVLVNQIIMPALGGGPDLGRFAGVAAAGKTGFAAILLGVISNPVYAFSQIFLNGQKMIFLVQLFLPVVFLPLFAGAGWLMAVPAFAIALLASVPSQYSLTYHYPAIMVPFVFVLAILGLQRLNLRRTPWQSNQNPEQRRRQADPAGRSYDRLPLAAAILVISLAMNFTYGWVGSKRSGEFEPASHHERILAEFIAEIPRRATVSAMSDLVPHLSNRATIYLFPVVDDVEVILFDSSPTANFWPFLSNDARGEARNALIPYLISGAYGLVRGEDGVLLLQRGYDTSRNQAAIGALLSARYEAEDLATDLPRLDLADEQASYGRARVGRPALRGETAREGLTFGPYVTLLPGKYQVSYRLKHLGDALPGTVATVDVFSSSASGVLASRDIQTSDFTSPQSTQSSAESPYQEFILDLDTQERYEDLEFRVRYKGLGDLWVDAIQVTPIQVAVPVLDYPAPKPPPASLDETTSRIVAQTSPTALIPGLYRATFTLKPGATPAGKIEVISATAGGPLAEWTVSESDFAAPNQAQPFTLDFRTDQPWPDVMMRVLGENGEGPQVDRIELQILYEGTSHGEQ